MALKRETRAIPIVFTMIYDPVRSGFVESLARPGGNVTGFTLGEFSLGGKMLELLKEMAPQVNRVAVVLNPEMTSSRRDVARDRGGGIVVCGARDCG